jgi:hypothetical protein
VESALHPKLTERVNEGLPLRRVVAESGGDTEEEGIIFCHHIGSDKGDRGVLSGGMHLACDFCGEGFLDPANPVSESSRPGAMQSRRVSATY